MSSLQGSGAPGARTAPGKLLRLSYIFAWLRRKNEPQIGDQVLACTSKSPCGQREPMWPGSFGLPCSRA